jgi:hypothetical protein
VRLWDLKEIREILKTMIKHWSAGTRESLLAWDSRLPRLVLCLKKYCVSGIVSGETIRKRVAVNSSSWGLSQAGNGN